MFVPHITVVLSISKKGMLGSNFLLTTKLACSLASSRLYLQPSSSFVVSYFASETFFPF
jgi:hypothetical protein